jgi:hypothetical protein
MVIKDKFELLRGTKNFLSESESTIKSYNVEENSPRALFAYLMLHNKKIKHFTKDVIFKLISSISKREEIIIVTFDKYLLPVTYNTTTKNIIINLKPFNASDISFIEPRSLYSCIVYGYYFKQLLEGKVKINEMYAPIIISFLFSVFIRLFGKQYGLLGIYTQKNIKLKFLLSCYILSSFFGIKSSPNLLIKSSSISQYNYKSEEDKLLSYDFSSIIEFIRSLSELGIFPGIRQYGFSSQVMKRFKLDFLPALEDVSRFFSLILVSDIPGTSIVSTSLFRQNEGEFNKLLSIIKSTFR